MGKRFLSLCLVLTLALAGCSGAADPDSPASLSPSWEESYSGLLSLLGTEPACAGEAAETDFEYNEMLNQNVRRVDLASGGYLEVNEQGEIVRVDNFRMADYFWSFSTLEDAVAILESELGLEGYVLTKNELFAEDYYRLVWEKQVGEYLNPHDGVYVLLDAETMQLVDLKFFRFTASAGEPLLTQEEAREIAEPYLENRNSEVRISCVRSQLDITGGNPRQKTTANLAYIFTNEVVCVSVDARTGEVIGLAYAAGDGGQRFVTPLADPAGPTVPPPSRESAPSPPAGREPAPAEEPPEEGPPVTETGFVPAEQLNDKAQQELSRYLEGEKKYGFLYVVDREGEPVPNLHCYAGEDAWTFWRDLEIPYDGRSGLSRNSGLLPVSFDLSAPVPLYFCNKDTIRKIVDGQEEKPPHQRLEFDAESLERLERGEVYQVVWEESTPLETLLALDHITVRVKNADGSPAADRAVYIHFRWEDIQPDPARGDVGPADSPYEPRYTDADGIARFVRENTFGTKPGGDREIVVIPAYEEPKSPGKKAVHIEVPSAPPWDFEVILD